MNDLKAGDVVVCKHGEVLKVEELDHSVYPSQYKFRLVNSEGLATYYVDSQGGYTPPVERVQLVTHICPPQSAVQNASPRVNHQQKEK